MSEQKSYAGVYIGKDSIMGYTLSVYLPSGKGGHFVYAMGKFYLVTTCVHKADGDTITTRLRPLLKKDTVNEDKGKIYFGEKIVYDNSGTKAQDYPEYLITSDVSGFDAIFDNIPDSDADAGNSTGAGTGAGASGAGADTSKIGGSKGGMSPISEDGEVLFDGGCTLPPLGDLLAKGKEKMAEFLPKKEPKKEEPKPEVEKEQRPAPPEFLGFGDDEQAKPDDKERFRFVFGHSKNGWVGYYTANTYIFIGITMDYGVRVLPAFITAKCGEDTPWTKIVQGIAEYAESIDFFICKDYDNILPKVLSEVFPKTVYLKMIWSLPSDASNKSRAEEVNRIFEKEVDDYWYKHCKAEDTEQLTDAVKKLRIHLKEFFAGYDYSSTLEMPQIVEEIVQAAANDDAASEVPDAPSDSAADDAPAVAASESAPEEAAAETAETAAPAAENPPVIYCFGYEKMLNVAGKYLYFVLFMQAENGVATKAFLSTIDDDDRNLEGWRALVKKAADKIGNSKYILFKDTSFNFVMDIKDLLPDTIYCGNIGVIPYDEEYRKETLALAGNVSSALIGFRSGSDLPATFAALTNFFKELGTADISIF